MPATPIDDVIDYLQTEGGTNSGRRPFNFVDRAEITFFVDASANGGMTGSEVAQAKKAFLMWAALIDKPCRIVTSSAEAAHANIIFRYAHLGDNDIGGQATENGIFEITHSKIVEMNRDNQNNERGDNVDLGSVTFQAYLHEIGHALGLSHPGPYNATIFDSDFEYGVDNVYPEDFSKYTVMSYFTPGHVEVETGVREAWWGVSNPRTPMLHDVATIQSMYGANTATHSGNTTYGFSLDDTDLSFSLPQFNSTRPVFTIWDSGGIDTIDASGAVPGPNTSIFGEDGFQFPNQIIDLREGAFSSVGLDFPTGERFFEQRMLRNNIAISFGTVIENAIGGEGADTITGNSVDNVLTGNGGRDTLAGGSGDDTLIGGAGVDTLKGEADDDRLFGGDGDDKLEGGSGTDTLDGGAGADTLNGGTGYDTASYANATDRIVRQTIATSIFGGHSEGEIAGDTFVSIEAFQLTASDDIFEAFGADEDIFGGDGNDTIFAMNGNDYVEGGKGDDRIDGGIGDDNLQGGTENDTLIGGRGNDILFGGFGADTMIGGDGDDTYDVNDIGDIVRENGFLLTDTFSGVDLVTSSINFVLPAEIENLTLTGFGLLTGTGNSLANTITGNPSANTLDGGIGADYLIGRRGNDTYIVDNTGDVVDETTGGSADIDTVLSSVTFSLSSTSAANTRGEVENLTLTGAVAINGIGNSLDNILIGNNAANVLSGLEGDDRLDGRGGADTMFGGTGDDTYVVDNAADRVDETGGGAADIDTVLSSVTFSLLNTVQARGNVENVTLTGNAAINATGNGLNNTLTGNAGSNVLTGGAGNDTYSFTGQFGNDTISDSSGTDKIVVTGKTVLQSASRDGNDLVLDFSSGTITVDNHFTTGTVESLQVGSRTYVLANGLIGGDLPGIISGSNDSETMDGKGGDDILFGNNGNDTLLGGLGNDQLDGGNGRDVLDGGADDDILTGGRGGDTFVFKPGFGHDTITDFSIFEDRLDISGFHNRPGISFSGSALNLDFGGGDVLTIDVDLPGKFSPLGLDTSWFDLR